MRAPIAVTNRPALDTYWHNIWTAPLSPSYPAQNFRANRNAGPGAGNPNFNSVQMTRAGDPRSDVNGGFYGVYASQATKQMFSSLAVPRTENVGGSQFIQVGSNLPWIPLVIVVFIIWVIVS
jgi:hypothetical protein